MNRIESLTTARMALGVALVMVLGAVIIPLPHPPRPIVAHRVRQDGAKEERVAQRPGNPLSLRAVVPDAATAPRTASRLDGRTTSVAPPFPTERTASRDDIRFDVRPTPLQPVAEPTRETLPPPPRDPEPIDEPVPQSKPRAPKIELGPIDDTRVRRTARTPEIKTTSTQPTPDERLVSVNVVLNGESAEPPRQPDTEAVSRLESRLEAMQKRLEELSLRGDTRSAEETRQTNQLLERVESMVSLAEVQRKIDMLQKTIEETRQAQAALDSHAEDLKRPSPRRAPPVVEAASEEPAPGIEESSELAPSITPAAEDVAETFGDGELPQIRPGPPYAPTPVERTTASPRKPSRVAAPIIRPRGPAVPKQESAKATSATTVVAPAAQPATAAAQETPEKKPDVEVKPSPAAEPVAPAKALGNSKDDEPLDVPLSRQEACYEFQLATKCLNQGDLSGARRHVRRAMAHDPKSIAARQLSERIEIATQSPTGPARLPQPVAARPAAANPAMISTAPRRNTNYAKRDVTPVQPVRTAEATVVSEDEGYIGTKPLILKVSAETDGQSGGSAQSSDIIPRNLFEDEPADTESLEVEGEAPGTTESP